MRGIPLPHGPLARVLAALLPRPIPHNFYSIAAWYKLSDTAQQIRAYIFDVVRSSVPALKLDEVFTAKVEIARDVKEELSKQMSEFGYSILQALITDIDPEPKYAFIHRRDDTRRCRAHPHLTRSTHAPSPRLPPRSESRMR